MSGNDLQVFKKRCHALVVLRSIFHGLFEHKDNALSTIKITV